jgi:TPP-dependent pyruvate/acetoin dehydrogenase alpha subunit
MITPHTPETLRAFEARIAALYDAALIPHPVHLEGGNEENLLDIFRDVQPEDYICGSWRMHYKCLLKGVPEDELEKAIRAGSSITLCFPAYRIISSAIVGGILPIALGLALAQKRQTTPHQVYCFVGDMTARTGVFSEVLNYAAGHALPLRLIIEDNGLSVGTPTAEVWGNPEPTSDLVRGFRYTNPWPHAGAGKRINF